jgi:hypothetical protein
MCAHPRILILPLLCLLLGVSATNGVRGVAPTLQTVYRDELARGVFHCAAAQKIITAAQVNDEFCDCEIDGADEPGKLHAALAFDSSLRSPQSEGVRHGVRCRNVGLPQFQILLSKPRVPWPVPVFFPRQRWHL